MGYIKILRSLVFYLLVATGSVHAESGRAVIDAANHDRAIKIAIKKTRQIHKSLSRVLPVQMDFGRQTDLNCHVIYDDTDILECILTDVDFGLGWNDGIKVLWKVTRKHNNFLKFSLDGVSYVQH